MSTSDATRSVVQCPCERALTWHGVRHALQAGWVRTATGWRCPDCSPTKSDFGAYLLTVAGGTVERAASGWMLTVAKPADVVRALRREGLVGGALGRVVFVRDAA